MTQMGAHSEVGDLRTVLLHRPGPELRRLTPRNSDALLFDAIPWVARAQEEHDAFAEALRQHGVEVLYVTELLTEALEQADTRERAIGTALAALGLGDTLRAYLRAALHASAPEELTRQLVSGVRNDEIRDGSGMVTSLLAPDDFLISPLPNLLFTRDSSFWVGDRVAVASLAMPARRRESQLIELLYATHPRFAGTPRLLGSAVDHIEGGDVLLLSPGVLAVGVGERTTPAGAELLARQAFEAGLAHTVLAVPIMQQRATMHLDTICTLVDVDRMVVYPNVVDTLVAYAVTPADPRPGEPLPLRISAPRPFLEAAAEAMGIERLHHIDTGLDPVQAEREQWDDGNNTLALAPRLVVGYQRNQATNAALEAAGVEVIAIAGSELGSGRGGPRCMSCPVVRAPL